MPTGGGESDIGMVRFLAGTAGRGPFARGGPTGNGISSNIDGVPPIDANEAAKDGTGRTGLASTSIAVSAACLERFRTGLASSTISRHLSQLHLCATMQQSLSGNEW